MCEFMAVIFMGAVIGLWFPACAGMTVRLVMILRVVLVVWVLHGWTGWVLVGGDGTLVD